MAGTGEGGTERGRTGREQGEGASETGKVDQKERQTEGVRRRAQKEKRVNEPTGIPLTAAVIQTGRGGLALHEKI